MKHFISLIFFFIFSLLGCVKNNSPKNIQDSSSPDTTLKIPNKIVDKSILHYFNEKSCWTLNDQPYSGLAVSYYQDSTLMERIRILNGKQESQAMYWHPNGNLRMIAHYNKGKLHGEKKVWSSKGVLLSHLKYQIGKPHGEQKTWYPTGEIHKILNLNQGKEEGLQQAFRKNGALYANFEAKDGRLFGLKKATLCYGLEDESIKYEN